MATPVMGHPEALSKDKLDALQVSVNEIHLDDHHHGIDRLTIQSPPPHLHQAHSAKSPIICALPAQKPGHTHADHTHADHTHADHTHAPILTTTKSPVVCALPPLQSSGLRAPSPTGSVRSSYTSSSRRVSRRSTRFNYAGSRSHHSEVSKELTIQAESEFFALMELMSGITLRSTSLKEVWRKIISERESHASEMDSMYERFEEFTETIERHEKEKQSHHGEHEERKKEVLQLQLDLKIAIEASAGHERRLGERDCELEKARGVIAEWADNFKYIKEEHEETKTTLEETQIKLAAYEEKCRHAEEEAEKHLSVIKSWKHKFATLESSYTEIKTKSETTHKELVSLQHFSSTFEKEKGAWGRERDEYEEEARKCRHREDEQKRKIKELTESYEKKKHDVHELTETVSKLRYEREEHHKKMTDLEILLTESITKHEAADHACRKWKRKHDEREVEFTTLHTQLTTLQTTHTSTCEALTTKSEHLRRLVLEHAELQDTHDYKCKDVANLHRDILMQKELVRRLESSVKQKSEAAHTSSERIERIERELADAHLACGDLRTELDTKTALHASLSLSFSVLTAAHAHAAEQLRDAESRFESVSLRMAEYHESGGEFEDEIERLHDMLKEARDQKEDAIRMRAEADRQRDEVVVKYEAKCREMEKGRVVGGRRGRWGGSVGGYEKSVIDEEESLAGST